MLTLVLLGGGAKFSEKGPYLHINNTALIQQISLFDTVLVMTNTKFQIKKLITNKEGKTETLSILAPPPLTSQ